MRIMTIFPGGLPIYSSHFRSRFEAMPEEWEFDVLAPGDVAYDGDRFGNATLHVQPLEKSWSRWRMILRTMGMLWRAVRLGCSRKPDAVVVYDPLVLGMIGVFVKLFCRVALVVEINGHIRDAAAARIAGIEVGKVKRFLFNLFGAISLGFADCVKVLNADQYQEWKDILKRKRVVMFHDYVPVSHFSAPEREGGYILCLGHPYQVKGVDVLLRAFSLIQPEFPGMRLKVVGYRRWWERDRWDNMASGIKNVVLADPVPYPEVERFLAECTVLAVPSRTEGMGRVFIEAMACGKACVGTRVGGIPNVVVDGETGFLVDPEDHEGLAEKLRLLLSDAELRHRMGSAGRRRACGVLSDKSYVKNYERMMKMLTQSSRGAGILFNGYEAGENA